MEINNKYLLSQDKSFIVYLYTFHRNNIYLTDIKIGKKKNSELLWSISAFTFSKLMINIFKQGYAFKLVLSHVTLMYVYVGGKCKCY